MIDLYTGATSNGYRATIVLEESGLPYRLHWMDLSTGVQKQPAFLAINPQGQIPALVDEAGPGGARVALAQSVAILIYVAEKAGILLPAGGAERVATIQRTMQAATDVGTAMTGLMLTTRFAPEPMPSAASLFEARFAAQCATMDSILANSAYLAGADYSIADIALFGLVKRLEDKVAALPGLAHLKAWMATVAERPAVQRALAKPA
ncbi:MAG: glutathione S-transferase family protein [Alphaproteobacteria bacterium]|nr:glutathione S-transferase family protein [Alphaproteobacteria bacterium]TAD88516.1 MAG: glutathione S-transferase family protein [Alphaproteobacteria bacterium]